MITSPPGGWTQIAKIRGRRFVHAQLSRSRRPDVALDAVPCISHCRDLRRPLATVGAAGPDEVRLQLQPVNPPSRKRGPGAGKQEPGNQSRGPVMIGTSHAAGRRSSTRGTPPDPQPPALEARGETRRSPITADSPRETTHRPGRPGRALRVATRAWTTQPARGIAPHCRPRRKITSSKCVARQPQRPTE